MAAAEATAAKEEAENLDRFKVDTIIRGKQTAE